MMTKACPMHSQVVDVDESNNGRCCSCASAFVQTEAAIISNNVKNNVIENCNSSSSSSHPSKDNNDKNNETSIGSSSSSSNNYFSTAANDRQELQCQLCNDVNCINHSSSISDNNNGTLQSIDDSLDVHDSSLAAVANQQNNNNGQQSLQEGSAALLQNNNALQSSNSSIISSGKNNNHVPSSSSPSFNSQPLPIGTSCLFTTAAINVATVVGSAIDYFFGRGKRRRTQNNEGDNNTEGRNIVRGINSTGDDTMQRSSNVIRLGNNIRLGSSIASSALGDNRDSWCRSIGDNDTTSNITHGKLYDGQEDGKQTEVHVLSYENEKLACILDPSVTVDSVISSIRQANQRLVLFIGGGTVLESGRLLEDYGIGPGSIIRAVFVKQSSGGNRGGSGRKRKAVYGSTVTEKQQRKKKQRLDDRLHAINEYATWSLHYTGRDFIEGDIEHVHRIGSGWHRLTAYVLVSGAKMTSNADCPRSLPMILQGVNQKLGLEKNTESSVDKFMFNIVKSVSYLTVYQFLLYP